MSSPVLDLRTARRWAVTARVLLAGARERIDALNVFPVADGDTGTNMYLTVDAALDFVRGQFELGAGTDRLDEGLRLIARGMLLGARGNSGVILSQLTRGLSEAVGPDVEAAGPEEIALAFETAARTAWDALAAPVEGTILTVARAAAEGARAAVDRGRPLYGEPGDPLLARHVVSEALAEAQQGLAETPRLLPALAVAGVVDAGGAGLVLVIEALEAVLEERPHLAVDDLPAWWQQPAAPPRLPTHGPCAAGSDGGPGAGVPEGDVEVMFLLTESDAERADRLRAHLGRIGSSVVVGGGPVDYQVHVHLDDPRLAVEAGSLAGVVGEVRLTSLADGEALPAGPLSHGREVQARAAEEPAAQPPPLAVVACGLGEGVHDLLVRAGAQVVPSGPRHRASAGQLLAAMRASGARDVVVLPNDRDTVLVAQAAAEEATREGIAAHVVPAGTLVQGLAALAVLDPEGRPEDVLAAMTDAARDCRPGALTRAERDAETPVGHCRTGQWLGIVDGEIVAVDDQIEPVATAVLDGLWHDDAEVLTVLTGARAEPGILATVLAQVETRHTGTEIVVIDGGQPTYPYLLGVE